MLGAESDKTDAEELVINYATRSKKLIGNNDGRIHREMSLLTMFVCLTDPTAFDHCKIIEKNSRIRVFVLVNIGTSFFYLVQNKREPNVK
jgi:hypothetical protein